MISTVQPRACMYSARLKAARIVPPMFHAVQRTMISAAVAAVLAGRAAHERGAARRG